MAKQASCEICAVQSGQSVGQAHRGEVDRTPSECCDEVREEVARLRACLTRAWLLLARGCRERALQGFADLYELAAGVSDKAWAKDCCGAHDVVRSLCHLLDRGRCTETTVLEAITEHIDALEETARRRSGGSLECGRGALRMRLRLSCNRAGVTVPASVMPQGHDGLDAEPAIVAARANTSI